MENKKITAKEYLSRLRLLEIRIEKRREEADTLRAAIDGHAVAYDAEKVQTSAGNSQEAMLCRWMDMEAEIGAQLDDYYVEKHRIVNQILQLEDPRYIELLFLRYVPGVDHKTKRLEEVACIMHKPDGSPYSYDHIVRLHGLALQAFSKKFADAIQMPGNTAV